MVTYLDAKIAPLKNTGQIRLHGEDGFQGMRKAGALVAKALDEVAPMVVPGTTTQAIDEFLFEFGMDHHAVPATLNYRGYTKSCCTSVNHVVCHGIPNDKALREGDIVNIDITYVVDGWHGDSSRMYPVGEVKRAAERLLHVTYDSMIQGIAAVKPGARMGAIGAAIQAHAEKERCSVVRDFCGHGIGQLFHDAPNVLHYGKASDGAEIREGMIFTIEPMINLGRAHVKILADGWTAVTRDRSLSAQYEHTVGVTRDSCEIFTLSPGGLDTPGISNN
ncbi:MAG: type I methionyl aminopeptidase [Pseudomonadota bacterium]